MTRTFHQRVHELDPNASRSRFWLRLSVVAGNFLQLGVVALSGGLLLAARSLAAGRPAVAVALMLLGWLGMYLSSHAIAHWVIGRLGGIRFVGYGISGTDHSETYPPGVRQIMSSLPFFTALTDRTSLRQAGPWARALMFGAGVTTNLVALMVFAAIAVALGLPGARPLLVTTLFVAGGATIITTRVARGDFAKARQALSRPSASPRPQAG